MLTQKSSQSRRLDRQCCQGRRVERVEEEVAVLVGRAEVSTEEVGRADDVWLVDRVEEAVADGIAGASFAGGAGELLPPVVF